MENVGQTCSVGFILQNRHSYVKFRPHGQGRHGSRSRAVLYHVIARGNERQEIFCSREEYLFLEFRSDALPDCEELAGLMVDRRI